MKRDAARRVLPAPAGILEPRTLANSHPVLLAFLAPGMSVLDVGSGPGALSAEIARRVDPGPVVGLDVNPEMVALSRSWYPRRDAPNLVFRRGDIRRASWTDAFDLVNAAQTLQWISEPQRAVDRMARAATAGGHVVLMEVDRVEWTRPPAAWIRFVGAFRRWRAATGLDNAVAQRLGPMLEAAGLTGVEVTTRTSLVRAADGSFFRVAGAWRMLAETRGRHVVAAGFCTDGDRRSALAAFTAWMQGVDGKQTTYEVTAVGRRRG